MTEKETLQNLNKYSVNELLEMAELALKTGTGSKGMRAQWELIYDLGLLFKDAVNYEFHDFANTKYAAPKAALHQTLHTIDKKMMDGRYDN